MEEYKVKFYARLDGDKVIHTFCDCHEQPTESDIFLYETENRLEQTKYKLIDEQGLFNYTIIDGELAFRDKAEDIAKLNAKVEISRLKQLLADTDYKAIKFAEGELTAEEYAPIKAQRANWRTEINGFEE